MKNSVIWICLLMSTFLFAQEKFSVSGTIKDKKNGETLLGATVYLKGTTNGAVTNEYGFFSLTAPKGTYTLVISFLGYQDITKEITLNVDQTVNFEIEEASTSLEVLTSLDAITSCELSIYLGGKRLAI